MFLKRFSSSPLMKTRTKYGLVLLLLTLVVLSLRLLISFQVAEPSYQSYFTLLQTDSIHTTGLPLYHDRLSYGGHNYEFFPLFYYVMAFFTLFLPRLFAMKLLPNLLLVSLIPLSYLLSHRMTKSRGVSLIVALFAGFAPSLFSAGINDATPITLFLPLLLLYINVFFSEHHFRAMLILILLVLSSPLTWLVIVSFPLFFLLLWVEKMSQPEEHYEVAIVATLFATWYTLLTYKRAFHTYGFHIITQSLPESIRTATFGSITLLSIIYSVGVIPLMLGGLALYQTAFEERNKNVFFLASLTLTVLIAVTLHLLSLSTTLLILSLLLIIMTGPALHKLAIYLRKSRISPIKTGAVVIITLFVFTSVLPALSTGFYPSGSPISEERSALSWMENNTPATSVLLATPIEGFLINEKAKRATVADEEYLLIPNPDAIISDIDTIYTTPSTVNAIDLLTKYRVTQIFIGPREYERYKQMGAIIKDKKCFPVLHEDVPVSILSINCTEVVS